MEAMQQFAGVNGPWVDLWGGIWLQEFEEADNIKGESKPVGTLANTWIRKES